MRLHFFDLTLRKYKLQLYFDEEPGEEYNLVSIIILVLLQNCSSQHCKEKVRKSLQFQ